MRSTFLLLSSRLAAAGSCWKMPLSLLQLHHPEATLQLQHICFMPCTDSTSKKLRISARISARFSPMPTSPDDLSPFVPKGVHSGGHSTFPCLAHSFPSVFPRRRPKSRIHCLRLLGLGWREKSGGPMGNFCAKVWHDHLKMKLSNDPRPSLMFHRHDVGGNENISSNQIRCM